MKIALAPMGTEGDIRPVAALGRGLLDAGHEVLVAGPPDFADLFGRHDVPFRPCGAPFRPVAESLAERINGRPLSGLMAMLAWSRRAVSEQFEALGTHLDGADRILGCGVQFAASSLAERRGIPYMHVAHFAGVLPSAYHAPVTIPVFGLPKWMNRGLWALNHVSVNLLMRGRVDRARAGLGLAGIGDFDRHYARRVLIAMDPALGPLPPDAGAGVVQTGYWRVDDESALPPEVEGFLQAGEMPVFVGFGSMGDPDPRGTARAIVDGVRLAGVRAIVARGWAGLEPGDSDERILVAGHLPHGRLFPRVAAVVHHGGAGTTWTVARSGVPHVVVPHLLDQNWWARRLDELGVSGSFIPRRRFDATRLAASLQQALDPARRPALERLAAALARRDGVAEAVRLLEGI